jgi:hypothetical protein
MGAFIDLSEIRFGRLVVIRRTLDKFYGKNNSRATNWLCQCDCGNQKEVTTNLLRTEKVRSCGCLQGDVVRKESGVYSLSHLYLRYKNSAKSRGICFEITKEQFKEITSLRCHYCNCLPSIENKHKQIKNGNYVYNGIDRMDNSAGYILENCVSCCKNCNKAKNKKTKKEFLDWAKKVFENLRKEKIL